MAKHRRSKRQNCRLRGRVFCNDGHKSKSLPCSVRDISYEGARIELLDPVEIPDVIGGVLPVAHVCMLSDYIKVDQHFVTCTNRDT
jgi:hypothetical protein